MYNINVYHAALHIQTAGLLGDPVTVTLPDGSLMDYEPQIGMSGVDVVMSQLSYEPWLRGGSRYFAAIVDFLCRQVQVAISKVSNDDNALLVFNAPEFLFKDSPRKVSGGTLYGPPFTYDVFYNGMEYLKRQLIALCDSGILGRRTLLLCAGTVWWYQPDHATGMQIVHNTSPVFDSSSRRMYHLAKQHAASIDGLHINASEVWDRNTEGTAAVWAEIDRLSPQAPVVVRPQVGGEVRAGVEICRDFLKGRLKALLATTSSTIDVHVMTGCGAPYKATAPLYCGRLFLRMDGKYPNSTTATVDAAGRPDDSGPAPEMFTIVDGASLAMYLPKSIVV